MPSFGVAPSATTTIEKLRPSAWRRCSRSQTSSMSNGRSGTSTTSAPPARPEYAAIQPAWRPITSTTITRLCDSAVVCSRSIASVAICTAVWKPNVKSVPARSLSIVFGTPTTLRPASDSPPATPSVSSPPIGISASRPSVRNDSCTRSRPFSSLNTFVRDVPRIVPPRCRMPLVVWCVRSIASAPRTPAQP